MLDLRVGFTLLTCLLRTWAVAVLALLVVGVRLAKHGRQRFGTRGVGHVCRVERRVSVCVRWCTERDFSDLARHRTVVVVRAENRLTHDLRCLAKFGDEGPYEVARANANSMVHRSDQGLGQDRPLCLVGLRVNSYVHHHP